MKHYDQRLIELGLKIAYDRKRAGYTQEELAEKIETSSVHLSQVETPSCIQPVSLKTLFLPADAFEISPS